MVKWKRDVIVGILFEMFAAVTFVQSFDISVGTMANIPMAQPGVYLRLWLGIFALLTLVMIVNAVRKRDMTKTQTMFHRQVVITLLLLLIYIFIMDKVGFFVSTLLFTTALILDYSWEAGKFKDKEGQNKHGGNLIKGIMFYVVISIIVTIATQYCFGELLMVNLPSWSL